MCFLFRLDLNLHADTEKKFRIWNFASKHGLGVRVMARPPGGRPLCVCACRCVRGVCQFVGARAGREVGWLACGLLRQRLSASSCQLPPLSPRLLRDRAPRPQVLPSAGVTAWRRGGESEQRRPEEGSAALRCLSAVPGRGSDWMGRCRRCAGQRPG